MTVAAAGAVKQAPAQPSQSGVDPTRYDVLNSPFLELSTPFTLWEAVKMALLLVTVPPRLLVALVALSIQAFLSIVAMFNWPDDQPLPPSRYMIVRWGSYLAGVVMLMLGFRVHIKGYENFKKAQKEGAIIIFNHSSYVDAVLMMYLFAPSGVSKADNARIPLIGTCIKAYQNIYVPEPERPGGKKTAEWTGAPRMNLAKIIADRSRDRRYPLLAMAPEGTCGDGRSILQFKTGAFVSGVPVLPVLLKYNLRWHNPAWTIIIEPWHFLRVLCQFDNWVQVTILPAHVPTAEERASPQLYAANVRREFGEHSGLPLADQSQTDYRTLWKAGVRVSWDGRRVTAPPGMLSPDGRYADLTVAQKPQAQ